MCPQQTITCYSRCGHEITLREEINSCVSSDTGSCPLNMENMIEIPYNYCPNCTVGSPHPHGREARIDLFRRKLIARQSIASLLEQYTLVYQGEPDGDIRAEESTLKLAFDYQQEGVRSFWQTKERFHRIRYLQNRMRNLVQQEGWQYQNSSLVPPLISLYRQRLKDLTVLKMSTPAFAIKDWTLEQIEQYLDERITCCRLGSIVVTGYQDRPRVDRGFVQETHDIWCVLEQKGLFSPGLYAHQGRYNSRLNRINIELIEVYRKMMAISSDLRYQEFQGRIITERALKSTQESRFQAMVALVPRNELPQNLFDRRCAICYQDYGIAAPGERPEEAARLPCGHVAGFSCLFAWIAEHRTCHICRTPC